MDPLPGGVATAWTPDLSDSLAKMVLDARPKIPPDFVNCVMDSAARPDCDPTVSRKAWDVAVVTMKVLLWQVEPRQP